MQAFMQKISGLLRKKLGFRVVFSWVLILLVTLLFYWIVSDSWNTVAATTTPVNSSGRIENCEENTVISQTLTPEMDMLTTITLQGHFPSAEPALIAVLKDGTDELGRIEAAGSGNSIQLHFDKIEHVKGKTLCLELIPLSTDCVLFYGNTRSATRIEVAVETQALTVNGSPLDG